MKLFDGIKYGFLRRRYKFLLLIIQNIQMNTKDRCVAENTAMLIDKTTELC